MDISSLLSGTFSRSQAKIGTIEALGQGTEGIKGAGNSLGRFYGCSQRPVAELIQVMTSPSVVMAF